MPTDTELLPYGSRIDLTNCEREPIHVPGHIQAHGVLLVFEPQSSVVVQVSANVEALLGCAAERCVGRSLAAVLGPGPADAVARGLGSDHAALVDSPRQVFRGPVGQRAVSELVLHVRHGYGILECEFDARGGDVELLDDLRVRLRALRPRHDLREYCDTLAQEIRALTGYDRVMVYRFADDWHGWVFAEAKREDLAPFLDLHYPASDIPAQARRLFLANATRLLVDARYTHVPLVPELLPDGSATDMSYTFLRGASRMYTEYLTNMGVRGTFTLALPDDGKLWGLVACHHYDGPRHLSYGMRSACEILASRAALHIRAMRADAEQREGQVLNKRSQALIARVATEEDLAKALQDHKGALRQLLPSTGFCIYLPGSAPAVEGAVPDARLLPPLVAFLGRQAPSTVYCTDHLAGCLSAAQGQEDVAAGLLAIPVGQTQGAYLLWFRAEQLRSVNWAGDPHKPVEVGELGERLTPRKSFELWSEIVRGRSEPWSHAELDVANRLRLSLGDVLYRERTRLRELTEQLEARNRDLDHFNTVASHDLREPLRAIANYARFLEEDLGDKLDQESAHSLRRIRRLVGRMHGLIEGLLTFSRMGTQTLKTGPVDLRDTVQAVCEDLSDRIDETGATVTISPSLPTLWTWEVAIVEILSNLIGNALKYSDDAPVVEVGLSVDRRAWLPGIPDDSVVIYVRDHGIGIAPEQHEAVFRVFHRLHGDAKYGDGTGTGLPIVRRLAQRLGGAAWVDSQPPRRGTTFYVAMREQRELVDV